jgi:DNA helicase II / ATP-dependent DNA helicase PcrA
VTKLQLNPSQKLAVKNTEGPVLIIAGPGSGKTFTLVERVCHLIIGKGVAPENILVSTFTEKAAAELITRISDRLLSANVRVNLNEMYIGTLHSICLRLLDEHREFTRLKRNYTVFDQFDQAYFLFQKIDDFQKIEGSEQILGRKNSHRWYQSSNLLKWINKVSEELLDVDTLISSSDEQVSILGKCYQLYQEKLELDNALDFSTIQYEAYQLLAKHPEIAEQYREKLKYLMIDEYQDTNTVQEAILFKILNADQNICVVGDDDQGLYRFRGATIRNILEFPSKFANGTCTQIEMKTNYRSHKGIIQFYNNWMDELDWSENGTNFRFQKLVEPPKNKRFEEYASVLKVSHSKDLESWFEEVHQFLRFMQKRGKLTDWNQVAFLFRSVKHRNVRMLSDYLEEKGIPVYSPRSNMFFDRDEIRLMIGAIIFLFPQFPQVREKYLQNRPEIWDYYDDTCLGYFLDQVQHKEHLSMLNWMRHRALEHRSISKNTDYAFSGLFYELLQYPMFNRFLEENNPSGLRDSRPIHNLALLSQMLVKFEYLYRITIFTRDNHERLIWSFFNHFLRFLKEEGISEFESVEEYAPKGCVSFMTIHQSKGLEFPIVIADSLSAVPRKQYSQLDELLQDKYYHKPPFEPLHRTKSFDFWRLYYTAFSRAQNVLCLSTYEHTGQQASPSKYLKPVYDLIPEWKNEQKQLEVVPLEIVKAVSLKKEYSFTSHITVYENCPQQYKFFKEFEFTPVRQAAMLFGLLVHETIEDIHKAALRGEEHEINENQIGFWFSRNYANLSQSNRQHLAPKQKDAALKQVVRYAERHEMDWDRIKKAEVDVSLVKEDYILKGKIDLIRGKNDTVEIIDFKSQKKPDLVNDKGMLEQYRRQLEIYAHIVEEREKVSVSKLHLYYTGEESGSPYVSFDKDSSHIEQTIQAFDKVVGNIEGCKFAISKRPVKLCGTCDMQSYCNVKN